MKILVLNYEFPPLGGGASPVTKELAENLVKKDNKKDNNIDIITMYYKGLEKQEKKDNINIYRVNCIRKKKESSNFIEMFSYLLPAYFKAKEIIKNNIETNKNKKTKEKKYYDLIHCHFIIPTGFVAYLLKKKFNIPYIITSHGSDVPGYNPDRFNFLHYILKPFWKIIIKNSEKIITPSLKLKNLILKNYKNLDEKKIIIIPNGINLINKKINLEKKEKIILYAGRLFKRKGVNYLIDSSDVIPSDWKIFICGDGPEKNDLIKIANKSKNKDNIKFFGWLDKKKLFELYEKSSVFVLPSSEESFGLVLIEAMMFGNAIITTKGTGTEEVVSDSGILIEKINSYNNSFKNNYYKDNYLKDLKKAISLLINNKKILIEYQKRSLKRSKLFSWKKISDIYLNEFKNLNN